ncbi:MAG: hypothetical protein ACKOWC_08215 [Limnohabitans sp.]
MKTLHALWVPMVFLPAWAISDDVPQRIAAERAVLERERAQIDQMHDARMRECWQKFAVNTCLREVRHSRHLALDPIRAQELQVNAQERAWRTQQREDRLQEKQANQERQP